MSEIVSLSVSAILQDKTAVDREVEPHPVNLSLC